MDDKHKDSAGGLTCEELQSLLDRPEVELDDTETVAAYEHIKSCDDCRRDMERREQKIEELIRDSLSVPDLDEQTRVRAKQRVLEALLPEMYAKPVTEALQPATEGLDDMDEPDFTPYPAPIMQASTSHECSTPVDEKITVDNLQVWGGFEIRSAGWTNELRVQVRIGTPIVLRCTVLVTGEEAVDKGDRFQTVQPGDIRVFEWFFEIESETIPEVRFHAWPLGADAQRPLKERLTNWIENNTLMANEEGKGYIIRSVHGTPKKKD